MNGKKCIIFRTFSVMRSAKFITDEFEFFKMSCFSLIICSCKLFNWTLNRALERCFLRLSPGLGNVRLCCK